MDVLMKRSTKIAPDSLSTSYLIGSAFIGISMITLNSSGTFLPGETFSRDMVAFLVLEEWKKERGKRPDLQRQAAEELHSVFTLILLIRIGCLPNLSHFRVKFRALANRLRVELVG